MSDSRQLLGEHVARHMDALDDALDGGWEVASVVTVIELWEGEGDKRRSQIRTRGSHSISQTVGLLERAKHSLLSEGADA